mmetsp:Transcript_11050/g.30853  ORF Transcript_11050/g.30853 Transcript_11050/m.30853 type:complete len:190 (+) Transcript_11050:451-1020(+)
MSALEFLPMATAFHSTTAPLGSARKMRGSGYGLTLGIIVVGLSLSKPAITTEQPKGRAPDFIVYSNMTSPKYRLMYSTVGQSSYFIRKLRDSIRAWRKSKLWENSSAPHRHLINDHASICSNTRSSRNDVCVHLMQFSNGSWVLKFRHRTSLHRNAQYVHPLDSNHTETLLHSLQGIFYLQNSTVVAKK